MDLVTDDPTPDQPEQHEQDEHDQGLAHDLSVMSALRGPAESAVGRRHALKVLGGGALGVALLAACQPAGQVTGGGLVRVPEETAGPFPGDGSNGPNVLTTSGVVRRDIRSSFGGLSGTAPGIPLKVRMTVLSLANKGAPLVGAAIYVWQCDREGRYSLYSEGATDRNYLRGVQATDATGTATFQTIYPGCYPGRWPHIHFEVYPSLAKATKASNKLATSQLALPSSSSKLVYATAGYRASVRSFAQVSTATDMVFSDGTTRERPDISGTVAKGFVAELTLAV